MLVDRLQLPADLVIPVDQLSCNHSVCIIKPLCMQPIALIRLLFAVNSSKYVTIFLKQTLGRA